MNKKEIKLINFGILDIHESKKKTLEEDDPTFLMEMGINGRYNNHTLSIYKNFKPKTLSTDTNT